MGVKLADLFDEQGLRTKIDRNVKVKNDYLQSVLHSDQQFSADELFHSLRSLAAELKPLLSNVSEEAADALKSESFIVFEGARGCLLVLN